MDATAGNAIGGREAMVTDGKVTPGTKPIKEILEDFLTKHVDAATMLNCVTGLDMKFQWVRVS